MAGRKTKLTPDLQARFLKALRAGNWIETCCDYAGIDQSTYYNWEKRAADPQGKSDQPFVEFFQSVRRTRAEVEIESVARIRLAGSKGNLKADIFFLERSYPERWGRKRLEITGKDGSPLNPPAPPGPDTPYEDLLTQYKTLLDSD